jgi:hypothetical protein
MSIFKPFFTALLVIISLVAIAQSNEAVFMKWKIKPGDSIVYKTIMEETDTANHSSFSFGGMKKMMGGDSTSWGTQMQKILKEVQNDTHSQYLTSLTENIAGTIAIEMKIVRDKQNIANADTAKPRTDYDRFKALTKKMLSGVMLRGAITEDGNIKSFYLKSDQKNLLAVFFQLPGRPVKVGDSWPLDVHFISMDQHFICDTSSYKNKVTVVNIIQTNDDQIVTLKYDVLEYASGSFSAPEMPFISNEAFKTSMMFSFNGIADFSIGKGRWIDYNGVMAESSTGMMSSQTSERYSLISQ